jgi:hypothetical protein
MFESRARPYQVIADTPEITSFENVIYVPKSGPLVGCLYDQSYERIDESCILKGTGDILANVDPATITLEPRQVAAYEGSAVYLGFISRHYGHFLIESLARAWAIIGDRFRDLPILVHAKDESIFEIPYIKRVFETLGVSSSRLLLFDRPTQLHQVFVPNPSVQVNSHIHESFKETLHHIARAAVPNALPRTDQPLYVSRTLLKDIRRTHSGESELEEFIRNKGGRIFHPQLHSIDEQIEAFNRHNLIIGVNGSAMHNLAFALSPVRSIQLAGKRVLPTYFLIDACLGIQATYCHCISVSSGRLGQSLARYRTKSYNWLTRLPPFAVLRRFYRPVLEWDYEVDYGKATRYLDAMQIFS